MPDHSNTLGALTPGDFLALLWGEELPAPVYAWMLPRRKSIWFVNLDHVNTTLSRYEDCDIYTGAGLAPRGNVGQSNKRVTQDEVAGLAALWADIDIAHPVHDSKKIYAPSQEAALELIDELPLEPTLLVNSGHGLQAWWVFDQPWIFADQEDHRQARTLSQYWTDQIAAVFATRGWHVDSVQNLDRIMRIPGTWNHKIKGEPKKVEVIEFGGTRYSKEEFLDRVPRDYQPKVTTPNAGGPWRDHQRRRSHPGPQSRTPGHEAGSPSGGRREVPPVLEGRAHRLG